MLEEYYWMVIDGGVACDMRTRSYEPYRVADVGRAASRHGGKFLR